MTDATLNRLRTTMDEAWQRAQTAQGEVAFVLQHRSDIRLSVNRRYEDKGTADAARQESWQRLQDLHAQRRGFDRLAADAFREAKEAYNRYDGVAAEHAKRGRAYVEQRKKTEEEIVVAQKEHESRNRAFRAAKEAFEAALHLRNRAEDGYFKDQCKQIEDEFRQAQEAFLNRLREIRGGRARRHDDDRALAERAGVPSMYHDNLLVSWQGDVVNIFFGGVDAPNGEGHGHYVMRINGRVIYRRDPFKPHGPQNFTNRRRENRRPHGERGDPDDPLAEFEKYARTKPEPQPDKPPPPDDFDPLADLLD